MTKAKPKTNGKILNKNDIYSNLHNIREALSETTEGLKSRAGEMVTDLLEDLQERGNDYQESIEDFISEKPWKALAIAAIAGLLVGKIVI
jgi:ElaB/YqjD/DUF883 family membrane-anchored ribosome-binding protein